MNLSFKFSKRVMPMLISKKGSAHGGITLSVKTYGRKENDGTHAK